MKTLLSLYQTATSFLELKFFPVVVRYAIHPFTITATMLLLAPLIFDSSNTSLSLMLGNYTNVCSATVSSIVLLQSIRALNKAEAHHAEAMQAHTDAQELHASVHEKLDAIASALASNSSEKEAN